MLILLPPSEGKAAAGKGRPLDVSTLSLAELNPAREHILDGLVALCEQPDQAAQVLGLSPGLRGEVLRNAGLRRAPALPARRLYTGVLYEALDLASLSEPARRQAERSILIFSALWGVVRLRDRIPPYRCPIGVTLPGVGGLGPYWRKALPPAMAAAAGRGAVLDLRSSGYAGMWAPPDRDLARRTATVRVLHERVVGMETRRTVVSHFNKATKGRLVRVLLMTGANPRSPAELVTVLRDLKYVVEERPSAGDAPRQLDIVVNELHG
jgi:cytoplasmic iron level regulating protein YaaA (DUF328/UPF0246 family)